MAKKGSQAPAPQPPAKRQREAAASNTGAESAGGASTPAQPQIPAVIGASTPAQLQVPAVQPQPALDAGAVVDSPAKPALPDTRDEANIKVRQLMRAIISYVKYHLKPFLKDNPSHFSAFADVELHKHLPLCIREGKETELLSFKAPWCPTLASTSLKTTDKYEAGGNIFWINPFPADDAVAGDNESWQLVNLMAEDFRVARGASTPSSGTLAKEKRLAFTVQLAVWAPNLDFYSGNDHFPGTMKLVAGHAALWGWYVAAFEALDAGNAELVALLWQAALTVTIQAHIVKERSRLAVLSISLSNQYFVNAKALADTFPAFAMKLHVALSGASTSGQKVQQRLEYCTKHNIRYNGAAVHRSLLFAALKYMDVVDEDTHAYLMLMERKFGKDVLSSKWNNLARLLQTCSKEAESGGKMWDGLGAGDLVHLVLQYLMWALNHEEVVASAITMDWLDKGRDGTPGATYKVLAKTQLVLHAKRLVSELPDGTKTKSDLEKLLIHFHGYDAYNAAFSTTSTCGARSADAGVGGDEGDGVHGADAATLGEQASPEDDPFQKMRSELCKTGMTFLDFLFDFFAGEHDKDLVELVKKHGGSLALLPWQDMEGECGTAWRDVVRQLGVHKAAISLEEGGGPPSSSRSLKRVLTEEGADDEDDRAKEMKQERVEAWKNAQLSRRKFANVSHMDFKSNNDMQKWLEKQKTAHQFVGKPGESHRVFVFNADTFGKEGQEPWKQTTDSGKDMNDCLEFMQHQTGPCDVLLSFDGRNVADRAALAKSMQKTRHLCELWVTYKSTKRMGRRVAWAADSREMGWISLPVPRTQLAIKERGEDTAEWAESTHDTVYSGVSPVPWDGLPLISAVDKARVLGVRLSASTPDASEVPTPPVKIFDTDRGMPLYWGERKPVEFWEDILWSLDAEHVVDVSPGSGSVGRACLRAGIQYTALCRTESHAAWVGNILDREACELITTNKSPLFEQDLATMLQKHFQEVLEQLDQQRNAEDKAPEEDD